MEYLVAFALVLMCGGSFMLGYFRGERATEEKLSNAYKSLRCKYDEMGIDQWQMKEEIEELYHMLFTSIHSPNIQTAEPIEWDYEEHDSANYWKYGKQPPWESEN